MSAFLRTIVGATVLLCAMTGATLSAHQMLLKGTVAALEPTRLQIKTGEEKKGQSPAWVLVNAKTKILRDKTTVTLEQAKIKIGERAAVLVDHDASGVMTALEIHLAAK